ncbi:MAG: M20/M25/M40 family metallo-hydrolase, partial [Pyrinomonadaceae bacterium]
MPVEIDRTTLRALGAYMEERRDAVLSLTRALVEEESPSGDLAGSRAVVGLLEREARSISSVNSVERIPAAGEFGEHLRVRAFGDAANWGEPVTLIIGHTDTVHPRGTLSTQSVRAQGERLFGPGVFDMKAACALALEVLRALAVLDVIPDRPVVLLLTCDEEAGSATG